MDHVIKFNMPWLRHHVKRLHDTDEQVNTDSIVFCYDEVQMPRGAEDGIMPLKIVYSEITFCPKTMLCIPKIKYLLFRNTRDCVLTQWSSNRLEHWLI